MWKPVQGIQYPLKWGTVVTKSPNIPELESDRRTSSSYDFIHGDYNEFLILGYAGYTIGRIFESFTKNGYRDQLYFWEPYKIDNHEPPWAKPKSRKVPMNKRHSNPLPLP